MQMLFEEAFFLVLVLARVSGLLLISPLLSNKSITLTVRIFLSLFTALLMGIVLYPDYHDSKTLFEFSNFPQHQVQDSLLFSSIFFKELAIGYLIGFCFNLLFEAMLLGGELLDTMIGVTTAQMILPFTQTLHSLFGQFLTLSAMVIVLTLDLHHLFFKVIAYSFTALPLGNGALSPKALQETAWAGSAIFHYGLQVAAVPFVILSLSTIGIGFISRALPEFNPLITGMTLRVVIGLIAILFMVDFLPFIVQNAFLHLSELLAKILHFS